MRPVLHTLSLLAFFVPWLAPAQEYDYCRYNIMTDNQVTTKWVTDTTIRYALCTQSCTSDSLELFMDIFRPTELTVPVPEKFPFVMLMHPGGFRTGSSRETIVAWAEEFVRRGAVVGVPNYRTGWDVDGDGVVNYQDDTANTGLCQGDRVTIIRAILRSIRDGDAAFRFMVANRDVYDIDTSFMYVGGTSAGAVAAINLPFMDDDEIEQYIADSLGGLPPLPCDLALEPISCSEYMDSYTIKGVMTAWGAVLDTAWIDEDEMQRTQVVAFQGLQDHVLPFSSGFYLECGEEVGQEQYPTLFGTNGVYDRISGAGYCTRLFVDPDADHAYTFLEKPGQLGQRDRAEFIVSYTTCFFKSIVCGTCSNEYIIARSAQEADSLFLTGCKKNGAQITEFLRSVSEWWAHPNPTADYLMLSGPAQQPFAFRLWDLRGAMLASEQEAGDYTELDLRTLRPGCYILELLPTDGIPQRIRVVKE
jgi:hypothetical protein